MSVISRVYTRPTSFPLSLHSGLIPGLLLSCVCHKYLCLQLPLHICGLFICGFNQKHMKNICKKCHVYWTDFFSYHYFPNTTVWWLFYIALYYIKYSKYSRVYRRIHIGYTYKCHGTLGKGLEWLQILVSVGGPGSNTPRILKDNYSSMDYGFVSSLLFGL